MVNKIRQPGYANDYGFMGLVCTAKDKSKFGIASPRLKPWSTDEAPRHAFERLSDLASSASSSWHNVPPTVDNFTQLISVNNCLHSC